MGKKIYLAVSLFNILIISLYAINYDNVSQHFLPLIIYITLFICVIAALGIKFAGKFFQRMGNVQLILFSFILFFLFCELIASLSINLVPLQIRNRLATSNIEVARGTMVEYINGSPFVKFKPNTTIRSQGYRGNDFTYEWKSDHLGFKNLKQVANKKKVRIVAVGDSFTESMGLATDRTWASILTRNGYSTYNLGVQGYSPTQMEGSLRKYGLHLNPDYIIIGYMEGLFFRNKVDSRKFTGGIKSIAIDSQKDIRSQAKYIFSAAYLFARTTFHRFPPIKKLFLSNQIINQNFKEYASEVFSEKKIDSFDSDEWRSTLSAFDNIIKMAEEINSKVILLYMPTRGSTYYKAATGNDLPENHFNGVEIYKMQKYAEKNNISFLNTSETLIKYIETIKEDNFNVSKLPYFRIDGHMSNKGSELVADAILELLANRAALRKNS